MFEPDLTQENALRFSRLDENHLLSTCSAHAIQLEDQEWPTAEHYYQTKIAGSSKQIGHISKVSSALEVFHYGKPWYRKKCKGWKDFRRVYMTRALYTKSLMYPEVKAYLLATTDELISETSSYDYYWGIGRDQRGENMLGKVWMDIRKKLVEQQGPDQKDRLKVNV